MPDDPADKIKSFLHLKVPPSLHSAVALAAGRELLTLSEFTRRCLIDRVRAVGIDPARPEVRP
jgi:predicted HicB family RNase H-like nuclease